MYSNSLKTVMLFSMTFCFADSDSYEYARRDCMLESCGVEKFQELSQFECALQTAKQKYAGFQMNSDGTCTVARCYSTRKDCEEKMFGRLCPNVGDFRVTILCYGLFNDAGNYGQNGKKCREHGHSSLAAPRTSRKFGWMYENVLAADPTPDGKIYTGLKTLNGNVYEKNGDLVEIKERYFTSADQTNVDTEKCLVMVGSKNYKLESVECDSEHAYICQVRY